MTKKTHMHAEMALDGFSHLDGTVRFFSFVHALAKKNKATHMMDFGAGRGGFWHDDKSEYRRSLRDLRTLGAHVTACDIDPEVMTHQASDDQKLIEEDGRLPLEDESLDIIVSDMTFEHIEHPKAVADELLRVLKPGGYICARTPNRFSYVSLAARIIPNKGHSGVLRFIQPTRKEVDVFPTHYRMNSDKQIATAFPGCEIVSYQDNAEPAYYFGKRWLYRIFLFLHGIMPRAFATTYCVFIRKPPSDADQT